MWVKQEQSDYVLERQWHILFAFYKREDCISSGTGKGLVGAEDGAWTETDAHGQHLFIRCLPDTVDPRGPKGK
jgi:hypothetical protein